MNYKTKTKTRSPLQTREKILACLDKWGDGSLQEIIEAFNYSAEQRTIIRELQNLELSREIYYNPQSKCYRLTTNEIPF